MVASKPPERRFMVKNLEVAREKNEIKADISRIGEAVEKVLVDIGFHLGSPQIEIIQYGYMPEAEPSKLVTHYWVTFSVSDVTARKIQKQRNGITSRVAKINEAKFDGDERKYVKLRKYRGVSYEATVKTMRKAKKIFMGSDDMIGFKMKVVHDKIDVYFDGVLKDSYTVQRVFKENRPVFDKAVKNLSKSNRKQMELYAAKRDKLSQTLDLSIDVLENNIEIEEQKPEEGEPEEPENLKEEPVAAAPKEDSPIYGSPMVISPIEDQSPSSALFGNS